MIISKRQALWLLANYVYLLIFVSLISGCGITGTQYSNDQRYIRRELEDLHERVGARDSVIKGLEERVKALEDRPQFYSEVDPDGQGGRFGLMTDPFVPKKSGTKCTVCGVDMVIPHPGTSCAVMHNGGRCDWNDPICPDEDKHKKP